MSHDVACCDNVVKCGTFVALHDTYMICTSERQDIRRCEIWGHWSVYGGDSCKPMQSQEIVISKKKHGQSLLGTVASIQLPEVAASGFIEKATFLSNVYSIVVKNFIWWPKAIQR